jgi:hypothetical protein
MLTKLPYIFIEPLCVSLEAFGSQITENCTYVAQTTKDNLISQLKISRIISVFRNGLIVALFLYSSLSPGSPLGCYFHSHAGFSLSGKTTVLP